MDEPLYETPSNGFIIRLKTDGSSLSRMFFKIVVLINFEEIGKKWVKQGFK